MECAPPGRWPHAIEEYPIQYVISGRYLVTKPDESVTTAKPVVMADPNFDLTPAQSLAATRAVLRSAAAKSTGPIASKPNSAGLRASGPSALMLRKVPRLPGTAVEVRAIAPQLAAYANNQPLVYVDQFALEGVLKVVQLPQVLVLSTHGFFLPEQSLNREDKLQLAAAETARRGLTAEKQPRDLLCDAVYCSPAAMIESKLAAPAARMEFSPGMEIVGIDLRRTQLVVLSARETGLGQVHNGEGVAGLRQAFLLAGAVRRRHALANPRSRIGRAHGLFFTNLAGWPVKGRVAAQRKLALIKQCRGTHPAAHPFYWAAFTLTGG